MYEESLDRVLCSVGGADFGAWMKFAGYDFIILEGKAERPVYLHVTADGCEIEDAREIWGKNTAETQQWLNGRHGREARAACIGPAGENLVKYAALLSPAEERPAVAAWAPSWVPRRSRL